MFFKDVIKSPIGNIVVEYSQKGIIKIFLRENIEQTYSDTMRSSFLSERVKDVFDHYFQFLKLQKTIKT